MVVPILGNAMRHKHSHGMYFSEGVVAMPRERDLVRAITQLGK